MIPELPITMLACTRIGAIHSVVFSAFSSSALRDRILDCDSEIVVTADTGVHGGKTVPLKQKTDEAILVGTNIRHVIVYQRGDGNVPMMPKRDIWWHDAMNDPDIANTCEPESMDAEAPPLHTLHQRKYWKTERRTPYDCWVFALYTPYKSVDF